MKGSEEMSARLNATSVATTMRHESSLKPAQKFYGQSFISLTLAAVKPAQGWDNFIGVGG
jgi:hypothetical protein